MSVDQDGWREHRMLVLDLLERHEEALKEADDRYHQQREECVGRIASLKEELTKNVRDQIDALNRAHSVLISEAKDEIIVDLKVPTEVQVAKITGGWQFWGLVLTSATSLIVAVIAVLK
jgi:hypothetical protein